jgi:hypothetical protein
MNSGAAFRPLTNGAKTKERKIIPPIQVTAARMWRTTRVEYMRPYHNRSEAKIAMRVRRVLTEQHRDGYESNKLRKLAVEERPAEPETSLSLQPGRKPLDES